MLHFLCKVLKVMAKSCHKMGALGWFIEHEDLIVKTETKVKYYWPMYTVFPSFLCPTLKKKQKEQNTFPCLVYSLVLVKHMKRQIKPNFI